MVVFCVLDSMGFVAPYKALIEHSLFSQDSKRYIIECRDPHLSEPFGTRWCSDKQHVHIQWAPKKSFRTLLKVRYKYD